VRLSFRCLQERRLPSSFKGRTLARCSGVIRGMTGRRRCSIPLLEIRNRDLLLAGERSVSGRQKEKARCVRAGRHAARRQRLHDRPDYARPPAPTAGSGSKPNMRRYGPNPPTRRAGGKCSAIRCSGGWSRLLTVETKTSENAKPEASSLTPSLMHEASRRCKGAAHRTRLQKPGRCSRRQRSGMRPESVIRPDTPSHQLGTLALGARIDVLAVVCIWPAVESGFLDRRNLIRDEVVAQVISLVHRGPETAAFWLPTQYQPGYESLPQRFVHQTRLG
jgi:hypothetical protein